MMGNDRLFGCGTGRPHSRFAKQEKQSEEANDQAAGGEEKSRVPVAMIRAGNQQSGRADKQRGSGELHGDNEEFSYGWTG